MSHQAGDVPIASMTMRRILWLAALGHSAQREAQGEVDIDVDEFEPTPAVMDALADLSTAEIHALAAIGQRREAHGFEKPDDAPVWPPLPQEPYPVPFPTHSQSLLSAEMQNQPAGAVPSQSLMQGAAPPVPHAAQQAPPAGPPNAPPNAPLVGPPAGGLAALVNHADQAVLNQAGPALQNAIGQVGGPIQAVPAGNVGGVHATDMHATASPAVGMHNVHAHAAPAAGASVPTASVPNVNFKVNLPLMTKWKSNDVRDPETVLENFGRWCAKTSSDPFSFFFLILEDQPSADWDQEVKNFRAEHNRDMTWDEAQQVFLSMVGWDVEARKEKAMQAHAVF